MTDEDKKKIVSEPPPPTDEIDGEWGDDDQTLVRELPEGVIKSQPAHPAAAVAETAVAPISVPVASAASAKAVQEAEEEDDDESEDEDEETTDNEDDEEEDGEHEDAADAEPTHAAPATRATDWIPEWAPLAVLGLLVTASIVFGLGLVGGESGDHVEDAEAAPATSAVSPAKKPSPHP